MTTGNTSNDALLALFEAHGTAVASALEEADFMELGPDLLVQHRRR